jgi:LPXTG-site transpeptidase (sortase) family protein
MRTPRSLAQRHTRWLVAVVLVVAGIGAFVAAMSLVPTEAPVVPTTDAYADLNAHRAERADLHGEASVAPLRAATVTPTPTPTLYASPIARFKIAKIGVDAPVITENLLPDGTMASPPKPDLVAWYDFTTKPGLGGNAVFAGHLDYINYGAAVFWNLKKLVQGDTIDVVLADGTLIRYQVTASQSYPVDKVPMREVLATSDTDILTVITCGGAFAGSQYSDRLVVRAVRSEVVRPS